MYTCTSAHALTSENTHTHYEVSCFYEGKVSLLPPALPVNKLPGWLCAQLKQKTISAAPVFILHHQLIKWIQIKINSADGLSVFFSKS